MSSWKIVCQPIGSWPVSLLLAVALIALVCMTYPARLRQLPPKWRRLLFGCRCLAACVLIFAMFRPAVHLTETNQKSATFLVLGDTSRSMGVPDGPGGISRRQALIKALDECAEQIERLRKSVEIDDYDFDQTMRPAKERTEQADGEQTAIGAALEQLLQMAQRQSIAGVLLLSDGAQRAQPPFDADPRTMAQRLGERQIPIYTVPFGTAGLIGSAVDISVEDLVVDAVVFEKKAVPVTAKVRVLGAAGRKITVQLLVEDRSGRQFGEPGDMKVAPAAVDAVPSVEIEPSGNSVVIPVELAYVPERPGEMKIAIAAVPLDRELQKNNNRVETLVTVRKGGIKVAYIDKVRPEGRAVRLLARAPDIQLDTYWIWSGLFRDLNKLPAQMFEPGAYDVYLIGDVPADVFGAHFLELLAARLDEGAGLMMMGGFQSFGAGGYAQTPLADCLPVKMSPIEKQSGAKIDPSLQYDRPMHMLPTSAGLAHYVMRLGSPSDNMDRWRRLPPLQGANRLQKKNDFVEVLAEAEDKTPLLFAHEFGKARVLAFAGDTTYLWLQYGFGEETARFWQQLVHWLARKEEESDQAVWARVEQRNYRPGASAVIRFGARDASGTAIPDATFHVQVLDPAGAKHAVTPEKQGTTNLAVFADTALAGDYWVSVSATRNGKLVGLNGTARFLVDKHDLELDNPAADPALLEDIALLTGGSSMPPEKLPDFFDRLLDEGISNLNETHVSHITLWDNWYLLGLFITLMSVEWILRKIRGLV